MLIKLLPYYLKLHEVNEERAIAHAVMLNSPSNHPDLLTVVLAVVLLQSDTEMET